MGELILQVWWSCIGGAKDWDCFLDTEPTHEGWMCSGDSTPWQDDLAENTSLPLQSPVKGTKTKLMAINF